MQKCAFECRNHCTALDEKRCIGCTFRKTQEELVEGRTKAFERINSLPTPKRLYILRTYHKQWRWVDFEKNS